MSNNTKTIVSAVIAALTVLFSSCGSNERFSLKEPATTHEEVAAKGVLMKVSPQGIATVKMSYPYGNPRSENYLWEEYRVGDSGQWKSYGDSVYIKLRGEAKVGDTVRVVRKVTTYKLKTGEVFQECHSAFAEIPPPTEMVGK